MHHIRFQIPLIATLVVLMGGCDPVTSEATSLDGSWLFHYDRDTTGIEQGWYETAQDRSGWESLDVPGFWRDNDFDGFGWFAREFDFGYIPGGHHLALLFHSVDDNARVWLNGHELGEHRGYNRRFFFDVSEEIHENGRNLLVVRVEDSGGPGGINQSVELMPYRDAVDLLRSPESYETMPPAPEWVQNAHIYELFVRVYSPQGNFQAVTDDLGRLQNLGVDVLWLMPIHPIGELNAKGSYGSPYAVRDYYGIHPEMGTLADFKALVDSVHARGMHIILDFVLNHTAWDNALITEHPDWYTRNDTGAIVAPPGTDWWDTADLNYDNSDLRAYLVEMLTWWIQETDIDGFRFDVAELVPNDFWAAAKAACKAIKPDVFFLAEGNKPALHLNGHDMTYSWNIWETVTQVARGELPVSALQESYEGEALQYPVNALRMRFTENHDKPRSRQNIGDRALNRTAWAFTALMKGNPLIYAGQEQGEQRRPDILEDQPIDWEVGDHFLERRMAEILKLRRTYIRPDSPFEIVLAHDAKRIIAYKHGSLLAFFNFSDKPFQFNATGVDSVLMGDMERSPEGEYILPAKEFGVFQ